MTPAEHYKAAEFYLEFVTGNRSSVSNLGATEALAVAQVHATLATAEEQAA